MSIALEDLWIFMREEGVGVGHVANMKERARNRSLTGSHIELSELSHVIGDPELEQEFLRRYADGTYKRAGQFGCCGP